MLVREGEDSILSDFVFCNKHAFSVQLTFLPSLSGESDEVAAGMTEENISLKSRENTSQRTLSASGFILSVPVLKQVSVTNSEGKAFFDATDLFRQGITSLFNDKDSFLLTISKDDFYREVELSYKTLFDSAFSKNEGENDGSVDFVIELREEEVFSNDNKNKAQGDSGENGKEGWGENGTETQIAGNEKEREVGAGADSDGSEPACGRDGKDGRDGIDGKNGRDGLDGKDGKDGEDGENGRSIVWLGTFSGFDDPALKNPEELSAFFNLSDGSSWIYTGGKWSLLAKAGDPAVSLFVNFKKSSSERCGDSLVITARIFHREEIKEVSWMKGEYYNADAFFQNAERTIIPFDEEDSLSRFEVFENGVYTLGLLQSDGQKCVESISVTNIDKNPPETVRNFSVSYNSFQNKMILIWNNPCDRDFSGLSLTGKKNGETFLEERIPSSFEKSEQEYLISDIPLDGADYHFTLQTFDDFDNLSQAESLSYKNIYGFYKKEFFLSCKHFASREDSFFDVKVKLLGRKKSSEFEEMKELDCVFYIFDGDKVVYQENAVSECNTALEPESYSLLYSARLKVPYQSRATSAGKKYSIRISVDGQMLEDLEENILVTSDSEITDFYIEENNLFSIEEALAGKEVKLIISGYNLDLVNKVFILLDDMAYKIEGSSFPLGLHSFSFDFTLPEKEGSYELSLYSLNDESLLDSLNNTLDATFMEALSGEELGVKKLASTSFLIYGSVTFSAFDIPPAGTSVSGKILKAEILGANFNSPTFNKNFLSYSIVKEKSEEMGENQKEVYFESSSWSHEYCQEERFCSNADDIGEFEDSPFRIADYDSMEVLLPLPEGAGKYKVLLYYGESSVFPLLEGELVLKDYFSFLPGAVIFLADGEVSAKNAGELLPSEEESVVAVCIGFSENGIPLGIGLHNSYENRKEGYLSWASKDSLASVRKIENLVCLPSALSGAMESVTFTGCLSGKISFSILQDEIPREVSDTLLFKEYLPAFYYCFNYGEAFMLQEEVKEDWYLPSVYELYQVYLNFEKIQETLNTFNSPLCENSSGFYYSSSQDSVANKVYKMNFYSGKISAGLKTTSNNSYVLAVREFE